MTKEELIKNLGTIAQSGTTEFLKAYTSASGSDNNLIGQFGVGFYSAFLAADIVTVISKHNEDVQHIWRSDAHGSFTVIEDPRGNTLGRGTQIILHVKEDADQFLDVATLKALVMKYSEFINFPIYLWSSHEEEKEVELTAEEIEAEREKLKQEAKVESDEEEEEQINIDENVESTKEEEAIEVPTTKKVKETVWEWELMNTIKPIWTRNSKEVTDEEYENFYKAFSKDYQEPLQWIHFTGEGEVDFKSLLYIPQSPPANMFDPNNLSALNGIKLYVKRVFITDQLKDLLPKYLLFLKGIVDSEDLPLNVSREMLQEHKILKMIKKKLIRKAIAMFQQLAEEEAAEGEEEHEKYKKFWKNYGTNIKLGVIEDTSNRARLAKLLMFQSSKTGDLTFLEDYVARMKEGQSQIYYLAGDSMENVESSPLLEKLNKKGFEVLYMVDPIDEYTMANLEKFDGKYKMTNIAKEGLEFEDKQDEEKEKELEKEYQPLLAYLKKTLKSKVEKVVLSKRLTQSPSALVSSASGWTANMERIVKAQALADNKATQFYAPRKILEINPKHPLIKEFRNRVEANSEDPLLADIASLVYDTSALQSGFSIDEPQDLASKIYKMLSTAMDVDPNAVVEEEEEPVVPAEEEHVRDEL